MKKPIGELSCNQRIRKGGQTFSRTIAPPWLVQKKDVEINQRICDPYKF